MRKKIFAVKYLAILLLFLISFIIQSCSGVKEPDETQDCPVDYQNIILRVGSNGVININDVKGDDLVFQVTRIEQQKSKGDSIKVRAYFHILTKDGLFVSGLNQNKKKKFICRIVDSIKLRAININKYNLYESSELNKPKIALAFVLDHSGSMGEMRARVMQKAIVDFYQKYSSDIEIYIYKFDNKVERVAVDKNYPLTEEMFVEGLDGFGATTALQDGIGKAIEDLSKLSNYTKVIVPLTDGLENSSTEYLNPDTLVFLAQKNEITICPIGFGDNIDKRLLADKLAAKTGGSYHQICRTDDFNIIFTDIYNRLVNFYLAEFNIIKAYGVHNFYFTTCIEQKGKSDISLRATNSIYIEPPKLGETIVIQNIYFDFDSFKLKEDLSKEALENIYYFLIENPEVHLEIHGHTDSKGDDAYNDNLSLQRAEAVKNYLVKKGIDKSKLTVKGFGERVPIADNETEEGRAINRRVEFLIQNAKPKTEDYRYYKTPEESFLGK